MIDKLKSRFDKKESELIQRYKFNNRKQNPGESAEDFVLAVKLQAEFCNFGTFKEAASRERIVAGLRDVQLQKTLLNESKLTLDSAEKIIASWELAGNNAKTLGIGAGDEQIAALKQSESRKCGSALEKLAVTYDRARNLNQSPQAGGSRGSIKSRLWYKPYNTHSHAGPREGRSWEKHVRFQPADYRRSRDEQRYETRSCDFCGKRGHLKRKCFKLKSLRKDAVNSVISAGPEVNSLGDLFHRMRTETDSNDEKDFSGELQCMHVSSINNISNPCLIEMEVEGKPLTMEVDCGSSVTVIGKEQYLSSFSIPLLNSSKQLIVVNGAKLKIEGEANVKVKLREKEAILKLLVLNCTNAFIPLLGRPWQRNLLTFNCQGISVQVPQSPVNPRVLCPKRKGGPFSVNPIRYRPWPIDRAKEGRRRKVPFPPRHPSAVTIDWSLCDPRKSGRHSCTTSTNSKPNELRASPESPASARHQRTPRAAQHRYVPQQKANLKPTIAQ
ncbi:uncharacterized protein LOC131696252 [Topomyia yanbarensis]|uniref:uncharacterized protein LOC131696252 n=1 Tax=Topomyia yanbarensis TaxID=2498891 RepID=UPI00273C389B|nr:uncharacterized protein LOC131696252 [Topomyia yanbarensis]